VTADRARRRAVLMLSALAGAMLLAGVLPWATGGESSVRFLGLPLLLAGLLVLGVTLRVWVAGRRPAPSAPPVERRCDGCACGLAAGCATTDRSHPAAERSPAATADADRSTRAPEPTAVRASADGSAGRASAGG
jgi:hypothetical protein